MLLNISNQPTFRDYLLTFGFCLFFTSANVFPLLWSGNELMYFGLADKSINPNDYGAGSAFFESSNHRFFFDWIAGHSINYLGFDNAKSVLGVIIWILFSLSLAALALNLRINIFFTCLVLSIFISKQSLLGNEWMLGTIEPKALAYPLVIFALSFAIKQRWLPALILIFFATCAHFLVGSYWGLSILLLFLFNRYRAKIVIPMIFGFILLGISFMYLMLVENSLMNIKFSNTTTSLAEIYGPFRHSHHVAPFIDGFKEFSKVWLPGLLGHISLAIIILLSPSLSSSSFKNFGRLLVVLNLYIALAMLISFMDRHTHIFAQLYMFRPSSLIFLLSIFLIMIVFQQLLNKRYVFYLQLASLLLAFNLYFFNFSTFVYSSYKVFFSENRYEAVLTRDQKDILKWIELNTKTDEIILIDSPNKNNVFDIGIELFLKRKTYVNWKLIPTNNLDMVEWYKRIITRNKAFNGECKNFELIYAVYVIHENASEVSSSCLTSIYDNNNYSISRVKSNL